MPNIIPIKDLRDTNKLSELCHASDEPIFITKNGYGDMVIMSIAAYEQRMALLDTRTKVLEGIAQADAGALRDGPAFMAEMKQKYGL